MNEIRKAVFVFFVVRKLAVDKSVLRIFSSFI